REMDCEGFKAHVKDVELEHLELPHLGKHGRESSLVLDESSFEKILRIASAHLIPPGNLALTLGVPLYETVINV
ncbi:hypothetical protein KI387_015150, partial [Taxus chinensis]